MTEQTFDIKETAPFLMLPELIKEPEAVIQEFFKQFHLLDAQEFFWEVCKGALASPDYDSAYDRSNLLFFADLMAQFFAAVQQIHAPEKTGSTPLPEVEEKPVTEEAVEQTPENYKGLQKQMNFLLNVFSSMSLEEMERDLDNWLKVALSTNNLTYQDGKDRGNLIALHEQLIALVRSLHQFSKEVNPEKPDQL